MSASQLPSKYRWFSTGNLPRNAGFQPASPGVALVAKPAIPLRRPHLPTGKSALQTPPEELAALFRHIRVAAIKQA